jgi:hypothetical protein
LDYFVNLDAWLSALIFAGLMALGWGVGVKMRIFGGASESGSTRIEDGALALFGLLLAFCFSGAANRYEARKELLRDDVIAISDFADTSSLLAEPERHQLTVEIQRSVEQRIRFGRTQLDAPEMPGVIKNGQESQARMRAIIRGIIAQNKTPTLHTPLVNTFNDLTSAHDKRLYGVRDHVNENIVMMLVMLGVFTTLTMGRLQDPGGRHNLLRISAYIGLVAMVFYVTVDLEQPRRGLITVSQEPMRELSAALHAPNP